LFLCLFLSAVRCEESEASDEDDFGWGLDEDSDEYPKEIIWEKVEVVDVLIIGSGPAGCTAALYAARAGLSTVVLHGNVPGGQLTQTTDVENYPAFEGTGTELVEKMKDQSMKYGAKFFTETVQEVNLSVFPRRIVTKTNVGFLCRSLIIATGAKAKYLGLPSEERLKNKGVSACAICDGRLFAHQDVAVVGGGDVAIEEALYLAKICRNVTLFHRRDKLRASHAMQKKLAASTVNVVYDTVVSEVLGDEYVTGVLVKNVKTGDVTNHSVAALFVAIGHEPETKLFEGQLDIDKSGYFVTDGSPNTKVPGVFVAGDCADKVYRQAITSAGTGCQAALLAERYISEIDNQ
jgi:thioredoxin reductase (NADPH)